MVAGEQAAACILSELSNTAGPYALGATFEGLTGQPQVDRPSDAVQAR